MKGYKQLLAALIITALGSLIDPIVSNAQNFPDTTRYQIITNDGNEYIGIIISEGRSGYVLKTESIGTITIQKRDVKSLKAIQPEKMVLGEYWFDNPQSTRYLFSTNAYGVKKGEGYYQNVWVLFNQVAYGVTDNFTIGAGTIPLFLFAGAATPVWVTPRVSIPLKKDRINIAAGALIGRVLGAEEAGFGILYGQTTFGTRDTNVTLGMGYGYSNGDFADLPTFTLSGLFRLSSRGYFITENYFIGGANSNTVLISLGGRHMFRGNALDFGLVMPYTSDTDGLIAIPWLGVTIPFGK